MLTLGATPTPRGTPTDWTGGTGEISTGTTITVPANGDRQWLFVQNQDTTALSVTIAAASGNSVVIELAPATASGGAGGTFERSIMTYVPLGEIVITGTNGKKVAVAEG